MNHPKTKGIVTFYSQDNTKAAADAAVQFISGEEVDAKIPVDYIKVTNANAQEILDKLK